VASAKARVRDIDQFVRPPDLATIQRAIGLLLTIRPKNRPPAFSPTASRAGYLCSISTPSPNSSAPDAMSRRAGELQTLDPLAPSPARSRMLAIQLRELDRLDPMMQRLPRQSRADRQP